MDDVIAWLSFAQNTLLVWVMARRRLGDMQPILFCAQVLLYVEGIVLLWMSYFARDLYATIWPITNALFDNVLLLMIVCGCCKVCPWQRFCKLLIAPEILFKLAAWQDADGMRYIPATPHYTWEVVDFIWTGILIYALYTGGAATPRTENEYARSERPHPAA